MSFWMFNEGRQELLFICGDSGGFRLLPQGPLAARARAVVFL